MAEVFKLRFGMYRLARSLVGILGKDKDDRSIGHRINDCSTLRTRKAIEQVVGNTRYINQVVQVFFEDEDISSEDPPVSAAINKSAGMGRVTFCDAVGNICSVGLAVDCNRISAGDSA